MIIQFLNLFTNTYLLNYDNNMCINAIIYKNIYMCIFIYLYNYIYIYIFNLNLQSR